LPRPLRASAAGRNGLKKLVLHTITHHHQP
jgi:hypothetical protein